MIKYVAVAPQMASWSERLWQAAIAFLVILCIVLGILEVWALFYRESKGKVIVKEVCICIFWNMISQFLQEQHRVGFFSCTVNLQYMHDIVLVIWLWFYLWRSVYQIILTYHQCVSKNKWICCGFQECLIYGMLCLFGRLEYKGRAL